MLNGEIFRQRLKIANAHVVADSIDYLEANFSFLSNDWDGLDKWVHFAKDSIVYDIRLTEDCIRKEDHLNLSAGMWRVYLHGNEFRDGKVIQRITTDEAVLYVLPTGTLDGEPFPEMPASVTEQILARLENIEQNGGGSGGAEAFIAEYGKSTFAEILTAINAGTTVILSDTDHGYYANLVLYDYDIVQFTYIRGVISMTYSVHDNDSWTKTETRLAREGAGGGASFELGNALEMQDGKLNVMTTDAAEEDNTLPITSSGVYTIVGNISAILDTI